MIYKNFQRSKYLKERYKKLYISLNILYKNYLVQNNHKQNYKAKVYISYIYHTFLLCCLKIAKNDCLKIQFSFLFFSNKNQTISTTFLSPQKFKLSGSHSSHLISSHISLYPYNEFHIYIHRISSQVSPLFFVISLIESFLSPRMTKLINFRHKFFMESWSLVCCHILSTDTLQIQFKSFASVSTS